MSILSNILSDYSISSLSLPFIHIRAHAFYSCDSLTSASFPNATSIGDNAFSSCSELTSASFPSVTSIGQYVFNACKKLASVSFPNATSIGYAAFKDCTSLTSVSFPNATSISTEVFNNCTHLTTLYIGTSTSTVCTLEGKSSIPSSVTTIYVPSSLVDSYKSATNWSSFADKIVAYTG